MPTTIRQETQIKASDVYDDTIAAGSAMESGSTDGQYDLNTLRSRLKQVIGSADWYTAIAGRTLTGLDSALTTVEEATRLYPVNVLTDVAVGGSDNFVVLNVAGSEAPTLTAAVGAVATEGAVVVQHGGTFGTHALAELAGTDALSPKNVVYVRDASTKEPITSGGRDVYGLLQSELATDGHTFDDTTNQVQISFVRQNAAGDDLEAVPAADIQGKTINYAYVVRKQRQNMPENAYMSPYTVFVDKTATVDVTLDAAIDNQSGVATQVQNIDWDIADTNELAFTADAGAKDMLKLSPTAGGDTLLINVDTLDVDLTNDANFSQGAAFDTGGTTLNVGVTAGQIDSAGALTVASGGAGDLTLDSVGEVLFDDGYRGASSFSVNLPLADSSAEWTAFDTAFGEVSLLAAMVQASTAASSISRSNAKVNAGSYVAGTNMTGVGGSLNLSAQLGDYSAVTFLTDVDVFVNGVLQLNGVAEDVYEGTTPANGDLKFTYKLSGNGSYPDHISMMIRA